VEAGSRRSFAGRHVAIALGVLALTSLVLLFMGREPICRCGTVKLWHGIVVSSENSQHVSDWYSPSHLIHGFIFYGLLWLVARRTPLGLRLVAATAIEALWEVVENTDAVINRYREATIALDYFGDSVLNSASDILFMALGFVLASRLPVWVTVLTALAFEVFTAWLIRDNLTLNVLMLLWPQQAIRNWQSG
jgi:polyferredoxin